MIGNKIKFRDYSNKSVTEPVELDVIIVDA